MKISKLYIYVHLHACNVDTYPSLLLSHLQKIKPPYNTKFIVSWLGNWISTNEFTVSYPELALEKKGKIVNNASCSTENPTFHTIA